MRPSLFPQPVPTLLAPLHPPLPTAALQDWPVMPVEVLNFHLKPWDFFTQVRRGKRRVFDGACPCCTAPCSHSSGSSCGIPPPTQTSLPMAQNPTLDLSPIPNKRTIDFDRGGGAKAGGGGGLAASCCAATARTCCGGGGACTCQPGACACAGGECSSASRAAPSSCCAKPAAAEPAAPQPSSRL